MFSGHWIFLVIGNNGDGDPFAWQRGQSIHLYLLYHDSNFQTKDLYLDVGPQETVTVTPTVTFSVTSTPIVTVTSTM